MSLNLKPKKKVTWIDREVEVLLCTVIEENLKQVDGKKDRSKEIYRIAEQKLVHHGFERDVEQIQTKMKNLKRQYLSGEKMPHYALVDEIFSSYRPEFIEEEKIQCENANKEEQRMKTRKITWSDREVEVLLHSIIEEKTLKKINEIKYRNTDVYKVVHKKLMEHGYQRDVEQIRTKVKNLKKQYLSGDGEIPHYELCHAVFSHEPVFIEVQSENIPQYELLDEIITYTPVEEDEIQNENVNKYEDSTMLLQNNNTETRRKIKKKITWNDKEVEILLRIFIKEENQKKMEGKTYRNRDIYKIVEQKMMNYGYKRDVEQIKTKMKNLKKQYLTGEEIPHYVLVDIIFSSCKPEGIEEDDGGRFGESSSSIPPQQQQLQSSSSGKKRKMTWNDEEVEILLRTFIKEESQKKEEGKKYRNRDIYKVVHQKLMENEYERDVEQIRTKLQHLKKQYLTGEEDIPHYELVDEIFSSYKTEEGIEEEEEDEEGEVQTRNGGRFGGSSGSMPASSNSKKRKVTWSDEEVEILLCTVKEEEMQKKSDGKKYRSKDIFKTAQQKLMEHGYQRNVEQIKTKMKNLKKQYLTGEEKIPHYELLHEILSFREGEENRVRSESGSRYEEDETQGRKRRKLTTWCDKEVEILLFTVKEEITSKKIRSIKNGKVYHGADVYKIVQRKLADHDFERDVEQIKTKMKRLKKEYLAGENIPHYELLDEIFNSRRQEIIEGEEGGGEEDEIQSEANTSKFGESSSIPEKKRKEGGGFFDQEDELINKHQKWLAEEFRKQRQFESQQNELFRQDFRKLVNLIKKNSSEATVT